VFAMRYKMIGLKIAYYRKMRGYTQGQLAGKIGISTTYLGQIERGNNGKSYSLETLLSIAVGLDIDVNLLLSSSENI
jgi:transcriptional regulator with XRE-family HTH domain